MSDPAPSVDRQTLADLVAAMGAAPTDDVVHMMVPLMRQVAALHAQGRVAALGGADVFEGDDGALNLVRAMGQPPTLNLDGLQRTQPRVVSGLKIVGEYRVTTDAASGSQVEDLSAATESGEEITKPVYLPGYRSWEIEIGHHDDITDVFQLGMIMASLACGLDFTRDGEVERFSKARQNLFALAPRLHPVVATLILETTALNRQDRARDIDSLAQRLLSYRDQPAGLAVERVLAEAKGAPDRRAAVLAHLRDRLFDLSRRNRLIHFRPTQASVNLTEASVPLVLRVESIRSEQICAWSDGLSKSLLPGGAVALNTCLRFEEHPYLPSALDRIIQETRRDRADYGFSNLRLVIGFLHWNNLKDAPDERIVSPLLWLPVEVTKKKGVRDQYILRCTDEQAEFNPALRHFLRQLYDIHLPEKVDLAQTTLEQIHADLAAQIHRTEPGVRLELQKRPAIRFIHQKAIQRVRQFERRQGLRATTRGLEQPDFSYQADDYRPLGLALFEKYVRPSPLPQRLAAGGSLTSRPNHMAPPSEETERMTYALAGDEGHRYAWALDLTQVTLANFNYKKMSLVRDYNQLIDAPGEQPAFDRMFSIEPRALQNEPPPPLEPAEQWGVVASDATQDAAVALARTDQSFIIQGPPGTGKSQTITNLIADYAARGKRVLFVCEKRAALDVVFHRLAQAGLDKLACLIHDSQDDKKSFVADLRDCYEAWSQGEDTLDQNRGSRDRTLAALQTHRTAIALFDEAVSIERPEAGASIRRLVRRALTLPAPAPDVGPKLREQLPDLAEWDACRALVARVARTMNDSFGLCSLAEHPYSRLSAQTAADARAYGQVETFLADCERLLAQVEAALDDGQMLLSAELTLRDALDIARAARIACDSGLAYNLVLLDPHSSLSSELNRVAAALADKEETKVKSAEAAKHWREPLTPEDTAAALDQARRQEPSFFKFFSGEWRRLNKTVRQRYDFSAHAVKPTVTSVLERLQACQAADDAWRADLKSAERQFQTSDFGDLLRRRQWLIERLADHGRIAELIERARQAADPVAFMAAEAACLTALESLDTLLAAHFDGGAAMSLAELGEALRDMVESLEDLPEVLPLLNEAHRAGPRIAFALRTLPLAPDALDALVVDEAIARVERTDPGLKRFDIDRLLSLSRRASAARDLMRGQNSAMIRSIQHNRFLGHVKQANLSVTQLDGDGKRFKKRYSTGRRELEHEFGKTMRYRSIRELAGDDSGLVVGDLKPIWLMSPLSVSDTLPLESNLFDVVIFDEASQIPTEEAVPALARAPQVIVVGDEMQLPPTSFFAANLDEDEKQILAEEAGETVSILLDADSLLNQSARHLPATLLVWHYRSRSEALISFSNAAFYDGRLVTIPDRRGVARRQGAAEPIRSDEEGVAGAAFDKLFAAPLSKHRIADGLYEARANAPEARYIAELVREVLKRNVGLSIGVVAFSEAQQSRIEDALDDLSKKDSLFAERLEQEYAREEDGQFNGLFVKNLENVQGDERDIIILSICYGPGRDGRMAMNFGPINQRGGEKRLNVIFSRARHHMAVVSTIGAEAITNGHNDGARALRGFLAFAEAEDSGQTSRARTILSTLNPDAERAFANTAPADSARSSLAEALRDLGHHVHEHVGSASFRCDLAILGKNHDDYALGILLDHDSETPSTIDERFIFRPGILRAFGWRILHIPTTRWLRDPGQVLSRIEAELSSDSWAIEDANPFADDMAPMAASKSMAKPSVAPRNMKAAGASTAPAPSVLALKEFRFQQGGSNKFWKIGADQCEVTVVYGRLGSKGQTIVKTFATPARAQAEVAKLILEKTRKGYEEVA